MKIEDSVALVTGGNRGIGEAFVWGLLAAGARKVWVGARDPDDAAHLAAEATGRAVPIRLDVTRPDQITAAAAARASAPILARNGGGSIVNVLSSGGLVAVPAMGGYSPSKFAGRAATTCILGELAAQNTKVTALIVGSVDTRMAAHVAGRKEKPADIAAAGINAIRRGIDEMDTDVMAIEVRVSLARDSKALERAMAKMLGAATISTGR